SFSHRRHVDDGRIDCLVCHAGQPSLERPPRVIYRVMTMRECRTCHQDHGASIDCQTCHAYSFGPGYIAGE
ncbi:MAG: cytochrome c3 family protein, partial [Phycisphaerae bacterium]